MGCYSEDKVTYMVIPCPPNAKMTLVAPVKNSTLWFAPVCFTPLAYAMANKEMHKATEFGVTFESLGSHCILCKVIALRITNPETYIANLHSF